MRSNLPDSTKRRADRKARLPSEVVPYIGALLIAAACLFARFAFQPLFSDRLPFITFFVGVALSAWQFGLGPSLVTTFACELGAAYFLMNPIGSVKLDPWSEVLTLLLFTSGSVGIAAVVAKKAEPRGVWNLR